MKEHAVQALRNGTKAISRAGAQRSKSYRSLKVQIDKLAAALVQAHQGDEGTEFRLPMGVSFRCWASGEYRLIHRNFALTEHPVGLDNNGIMNFAAFIRDGRWLAQIAKNLLEDSGTMDCATRQLRGLLDRHASAQARSKRASAQNRRTLLAESILQ